MPLIKAILLGTFVITLNASAMEYKLEKKTNSSGHTISVVRMKGLIGAKEVQRWLAITSELDANLDTLFVIDSPGGNVPIGLFTIKKADEFISEQSLKGRHTWIAIDGECESMCVPFYFTWPKRFAVRNSKIGLHGVSDGGLGFDSETTDFYLNSIREHARARGEQNILEWLSRMISNGEFWSSNMTEHFVQDSTPENIVNSIDQLIDLL